MQSTYAGRSINLLEFYHLNRDFHLLQHDFIALTKFVLIFVTEDTDTIVKSESSTSHADIPG